MTTPNFAALPTRKWPTDYEWGDDGDETPAVDTFEWTEEQRALLRPDVLARYYDNGALWITGTAYRDERGDWCVDAYEARSGDRPSEGWFSRVPQSQELRCVDPETITLPI